MNYTVKYLTELNNEKRKQLTPENEQYYDGLLVYLRAKGWRSERHTEEVLLEMLDHLLAAQAEGKTAEEVFGKDPQALADEVYQQLPPEPVKQTVWFGIEIFCTVLGFYFAISGIAQLSPYNCVKTASL